MKTMQIRKKVEQLLLSNNLFNAPIDLDALAKKVKDQSGT